MTDILSRLAAIIPSERQTPPLFPIMLGSDGRKAFIPWDLIGPHEQWADRNHSQSLRRLAERGGLGWCEALAVLEDRRWCRDEAARAKVLRIWHEWQNARDAALIALVQEAAGEIERLKLRVEELIIEHAFDSQEPTS